MIGAIGYVYIVYVVYSLVYVKKYPEIMLSTDNLIIATAIVWDCNS